jgi:hypothetical protein
MTTLKDDMRSGALSPEDARDRGLWRRINGAKRPTWVNLDTPSRCYFTYGSAVKPTCVCVA